MAELAIPMINVIITAYKCRKRINWFVIYNSLRKFTLLMQLEMSSLFSLLSTQDGMGLLVPGTPIYVCPGQDIEQEEQRSEKHTDP